MQRRTFVNAVAVALWAAGTARAADAPPATHVHHAASPALQALIDATGDCVAKGEACLAHCLALLEQGDKTLGDCAKSVNQMLAVCTSLQNLAAQGSAYTARVAAVAADVCADCERECRKHETEHAECKACAQSCAACLKECKAVAAA